MRKFNVLIYPAGSVGSCEVHDALSSSVNVEVFGAASDPRHAPYIFKNFITSIPNIDSHDFIDKINQCILDYKIDAIFPCHDSVAYFLSLNRDKIFAKIIIADHFTTNLCRFKNQLYKFFKNYTFTPYIYKSINKFPCFIKPIDGQGGKGAFKILCANDIPNNINLNNYVICEFLPGDELTVDCFTNYNGNLLFISPRTRERVFSGITSHGRIINTNDEIKYIAETLNNNLHFEGLWWFQIKKSNEGQYKLLEISTRTAGSMCLTRSRGINLHLLSLYNAFKYDLDIIYNNYNVEMDRILYSRYKLDIVYRKVFIDFDDTIVLKDNVNIKCINFLYQCFNKKIKIILLTKHIGNIYDELTRYSIPKTLFYKIINIKTNDEKHTYIDDLNSIFIDNSFDERSKIIKKIKIPVFDTDGIDFLLDYRT